MYLIYARLFTEISFPFQHRDEAKIGNLKLAMNLLVNYSCLITRDNSGNVASVYVNYQCTGGITAKLYHNSVNFYRHRSRVVLK